MCDRLFRLDADGEGNLQNRIRELIVNAILEGHIPPGGNMPSCRQLAKQLSVSRNTVVLTYERLVDEGFLFSKERSGYFVSDELQSPPVCIPACQRAPQRARLDWDRRFRLKVSDQRNIKKPDDWQEYAYPFIYGQPDRSLFPFHEWRECARDANSTSAIRSWLSDSVDADSPRLLEQIHVRALPERGVWVDTSEILVTLGTQHSLYLLARLLTDHNTRVAIEDPGYVDARNIFKCTGAQIVAIPVDDEGLVIDDRLADCDVVYVTPSHQSPTTITMSDARRRELIAAADKYDFVIIEDDYEGETNFLADRIPALKTLDDDDRIIYVGSLSKTLAPGLRLGYLVGAESLVREARALRRLMVRHPPSNNQHAAALFLARGYHDMLLRRLTRSYRKRSRIMREALETHLPGMAFSQSFGGTSFWVEAPREIDTVLLAERAAERSILIEPGHVHFASTRPPRNYFRLGFAAIAEDRIETGIARLGDMIGASETGRRQVSR